MFKRTTSLALSLVAIGAQLGWFIGRGQGIKGTRTFSKSARNS